jgi:hypothetical protein
MSTSSTRKTLRLAVLVDGMVVEELHQERPGSVDVGTGLRSKITVYDGTDRRRDFRRWAPLWFALGLLVFIGGAGLFGFEVAQHRQRAIEAEAAGIQISTFAVDPTTEGTGGLGLALALLGLIPLATAFVGFQERPRRRRESFEADSREAPQRFPLFHYTNGRYRLDVPPELRGKISLGRNTVTISKLRKRMGGKGRLSIALGSKAKGKLLLGETTVLFQLGRPAPPPVQLPFPTHLRDPFQHMRLGGLAAGTFGLCALLFGGLFVSLNFVEPTVGEVDDRFLRAMEIPHATFDDEEEELVEEEEEVEDVLEQKDEEKVEDKPDESNTKVLAEKPETFSQQSVEKARGVGIARVLGTYGGPGEGTVFDVIQSTENDLGALFDAGMTQTVMSNGGDVTAFVAGGKGIAATGSLTRSQGLVTSNAGGAEIGKVGKKEKRIKGRLKSKTTDIYGDVDKKAVQATIRRRMSALQHCYEKALRTAPSLRGKMSYTITISTMGRVTKVAVEEDSLGDAAVKTCTTAKIRGWRFPSEGAEESSEVTFSVVFSGTS